MRSPGCEMRSIDVLGIRVDDVTVDEALDFAASCVAGRAPRQIATVNVEFIMTAQADAEFRDILNRSALNIPDSAGVLWAARRFGHPLRGRVAGSDMVEHIARRASQAGWKLFLLGAAEGVAQQASNVLQSRYPGLSVAGAFAGSPRRDEEAEIVERIRSASPDVLFVAYGAPAQDKWIARNLERLNVPVAMGVGGAFDFIAGITRRAPRWMRRTGLEWLHRLVHQPWRWRRMRALPRFAWRVLRQSQ